MTQTEIKHIKTVYVHAVKDTWTLHTPEGKDVSRL